MKLTVFKYYLTLSIAALGFVTPIAHACEIDARVSIIGNEFPAIQTVAKYAQQCTGAEVQANLTADHKEIDDPAMQANPAQYTASIISNSSIISLLNNDLIRPLDSLVKKYGQELKPNQFIRIDGKIMAIAFMANAQHLVYRKDLLDEAGLAIPKTYEDMLVAAKILREKGIAKNPIGGAYMSGWNLAQEFNNMFLGFGGQHFKAGTAEPNVNTEAGMKTLNMLKALTEYMNPDYLTHDSNATNAEFRAGNVALMNMWGSRAATLVTVDGVPAAVKNGFAIDGPLTVGGGNTPASTLWWDGWTIAKNISEEEAEATFIAMMNGINPKLMDDEEIRTQAVWLIDGYEPTDAAIGVFKAAEMSTIPYPMQPYVGLMHTALGAELADFLQGKESARQALKDVEAAYVAAAKEQGFL